MRDDLQDLVDRVSAVLGAPATLEAADFTLLAFCAHDGAAPTAPAAVLDAVRTRSILTRGSPPGRAAGSRSSASPPPSGRCARRTTRPPGSGPGWCCPCGTPGRRSATCGCSTAAAPTPPTPTTPRWPRPSRSPRRRAACWPARPTGTATCPSAGRRAHRPPAARPRAERVAGRGPGPGPAGPGGAAPRRGLPAGWRGRAGAVTARVPGSPAAPVAVLLPLPAGADLRPAAAVTRRRSPGCRPAAPRGCPGRPGHGGLRSSGGTRGRRRGGRGRPGTCRRSPRWDELGSWRLVSELAGPDPAVVALLGRAAARRDGGDVAGPRRQRGPHRRRAVRAPADAVLPARPDRGAHRAGPRRRRRAGCCCTPPSERARLPL